MVNQWRPSARCAFRHLAGARGSAQLQSAASSDAGRIPASLRGAAESRLRLVYLDGSFVTRKEHPGDFDACWDVQNVDDARLDAVFWDFSRGRAAQKHRFLGELFPAQLPEGATGRAFVDFFQVNKMSGEPKGILAIRLGRSRRK